MVWCVERGISGVVWCSIMVYCVERGCSGVVLECSVWLEGVVGGVV